MVYGIRPTTAANVGGVQPNRPESPSSQSVPDARIDRRRPAAPSNGTGAASPKAPSAPVTQVPVQAPAGTDPELWSVLSADERVFFAKLGAMGPLTYGRMLSQGHEPPIAAARGGRLDVKV